MTATTPSHTPPKVAELARAVTAGDRAMLGRAITLIESGRDADRLMAGQLLECLLPLTGRAHRIGITGVPGVGKSTLIDQLGMNLNAAGKRVAVLAIDPTSSLTGGSILGDKTRMARLSQSAEAFIRPSPTSGTLGGVTRRTRETMALVEAAGFDVVIVETVGVGQSETAVADMVDVFVVLLLAGGGDDLQGIKKGIIELADIIAINKSDGDNLARATLAAAEYKSALNIIMPRSAAWTPPVVTISGLANSGLDRLWDAIQQHRERLTGTGEFQQRREQQSVRWMHGLLDDALLALLRSNTAAAQRLPALEGEVRMGQTTPQRAVAELIALLKEAQP
jgi:LAO/AO transport system kinase